MNVIKTENVAKVAVNKSLLKEYTNNGERIVYLDNNTEFQIQIFNPYSYVIGVSFEFNDEYNYNQPLLVVRPGERIWLDRYLNNESKLLFSTYEVGNSKEVKEAIKNNGKLTIKFFKEKTYSNFYIPISCSENNIYYYRNNLNKLYNSTCYDNNCSANSSTTLNYCDTVCTTANTAETLGISSFSTTSATSATSATYDNYDYQPIKAKGKIETGRIEEGSHSNQKFQNVYKDFESWPFRTEIIKLLPKSQKPIYKNDLTKHYCTNCGRKINTKFKFCPYCGAKI